MIHDCRTEGDPQTSHSISRRRIYEKSIGSYSFPVFLRGIIVRSRRMQEGRRTETGARTRARTRSCPRACTNARAACTSPGSGPGSSGDEVR
jgi:hypothetical protein